MLDAGMKTQLKTYLENLRTPIELIAYTNDAPKSDEMVQLLQDIVETSSQVTMDIVSDSDREWIPSFDIVRSNDPNTRVTFGGLPLGHEFTSLVLGLLHVGGHPPKLEDDVIEQIKSLEFDEVQEFTTFFSLSCHNCPDVVQALNMLAVLNPNIRHTAIDGALFKDEMERREVMAVPTVLLNGKPFASGRMDMKELLSKIDTGASKREAEKIGKKDAFDVLVVGGGPAGAASAIYSARKGIKTGVLAERFGGQVMDTMGIENFISVPYTEGPKLAASMEQHVKVNGVDIMELQKAAKLIPAKTEGGLIEVELENGASLKSRTVILSTGARWRKMNVPGENEYANKGVAYCPHCDGPLFKGKRVAVIGGGNSGVEAAIDLAGIVAEVTLIEFMPEMRADAVLQNKLRSLPNVKILLNTQTTEVVGDGSKVTGLVCKDRKTEEEQTIDLEGVFVQIGLVPNTEWLKNTIALSPRGEIEVNDRAETSIPGVLAAGDCTTVPYKQIVIAMGEGSKAALSAFDYLIRTPVPELEEAVPA